MNFQEWCSVNSGLPVSLLKDKKVDLVNEIMKYKWMEELSADHGITFEKDGSRLADEAEKIKQIKELKEKNMKLEILAGAEHMEKNILQEENDKLKEELLHEQQKGTSIDTEAMDELVNIFDEKIASCDIPEEVKKLKEENEKKDKQIQRLVNHKKNRERQLTHIRTICEEKVEDVPEE